MTGTHRSSYKEALFGSITPLAPGDLLISYKSQEPSFEYSEPSQVSGQKSGKEETIGDLKSHPSSAPSTPLLWVIVGRGGH